VEVVVVQLTGGLPSNPEVASPLGRNVLNGSVKPPSTVPTSPNELPLVSESTFGNVVDDFAPSHLALPTPRLRASAKDLVVHYLSNPVLWALRGCVYTNGGGRRCERWRGERWARMGATAELRS
jgi:hypothetical protein